MSNYRINGFRQLERFYSIVYSGKYEIRPQHVSLYVFLFNQNNRNNWSEWFKCPFDLAMTGACIGSKQTYYKSLQDLKSWDLIDYIPGENNWKAPKISLICLSKNEPQLVPQCEPQDEQLPKQLTVQLPEQVGEPIYKLITNKLNNYITLNWQHLTSEIDYDIDEEQKFLQEEERLRKAEEANKTPVIEIMFPFNSEKFLNAWKVWLDYRKEIKKSYRSKKSEQAALKQLSEFDEDFAIKLIERSIAGGYQGLVFDNTKADYLKSKNGNNGQQTGKNQRNFGAEINKLISDRHGD